MTHLLCDPMAKKSCVKVFLASVCTVGATIIQTPRVFPCKQVMQIERCNKTHQNVQNMILLRGLEVKLKLL